ncbi:Uncharacterized protein Rs2_10054 [Raphanus sativus]|nr:Uncharacterized protein Rs2_10054 [Raphanus sativus]
MEANHEDSSFIAVMKKTHQRHDGTYVDERARLVVETYEKHVEERLGQLESSGLENATHENLDQREKNEMYIKAAGTSKQGHVFGFGALHNCTWSPIPNKNNGPSRCNVSNNLHHLPVLDSQVYIPIS